MIWRESNFQHFPCMTKILATLLKNLEGTVTLCSAHHLMPIVQKAEKVYYILLWLGPQGLEIYDSWTHLSDQQLEDPTHVWQAFQDYFEPKTNFRLARYQLCDIRQKIR